jgi:hypothetical protein
MRTTLTIAALRKATKDAAKLGTHVTVSLHPEGRYTVGTIDCRTLETRPWSRDELVAIRTALAKRRVDST